jgi:hypothetical protein
MAKRKIQTQDGESFEVIQEQRKPKPRSKNYNLYVMAGTAAGLVVISIIISLITLAVQ